MKITEDSEERASEDMLRGEDTHQLRAWFLALCQPSAQKMSTNYNMEGDISPWIRQVGSWFTGGSQPRPRVSTTRAAIRGRTTGDNTMGIS